MQIIVPKIYNDGEFRLISSSLPNSICPAWIPDRTYEIDEEVLFTPTTGMSKNIPHIYKSIMNDNKDKEPGMDIEYWIAKEPINKWAMLDAWKTTQSKSNTAIALTFNASDIDNIALLNVYASQVVIQIGSNTHTINIPAASNDIDIIQSIDYINTATNISIVIHPKSGEARVGNILFGKSKYIGESLFGANIGIVDYSRQREDETFGFSYLSQGGYSKTLDIDVMVYNNNLNDIYDFLISIRSTPVILQANQHGTDFNSLIVYGYYKSLSIILKEFLYTDCSITFRGLV